ncbi:MAG: hypothetical protein IPK04_05865 [Bdellovibrionales bacterium]|nr:hypothetical protein [Bdellovibrionales bacterium]
MVASQLVEKTKTLNNVSEELKKSYKQHRDNWLNILKADPPVVPSKGRLYIGKSERAAMADDATGTIELNKLFWQENSMTMVDSVVLALQESGHLIKMPLNHEELEQIGKALIRQNQKITDKPEKTGGSYARLCVEELNLNSIPQERLFMTILGVTPMIHHSNMRQTLCIDICELPACQMSLSWRIS